jgi:hypothetical protein
MCGPKLRAPVLHDGMPPGRHENTRCAFCKTRAFFEFRVGIVQRDQLGCKNATHDNSTLSGTENERRNTTTARDGRESRTFQLITQPGCCTEFSRRCNVSRAMRSSTAHQSRAVSASHRFRLTWKRSIESWPCCFGIRTSQCGTMSGFAATVCIVFTLAKTSENRRQMAPFRALAHFLNSGTIKSACDGWPTQLPRASMARCLTPLCNHRSKTTAPC